MYNRSRGHNSLLVSHDCALHCSCGWTVAGSSKTIVTLHVECGLCIECYNFKLCKKTLKSVQNFMKIVLKVFQVCMKNVSSVPQPGPRIGKILINFILYLIPIIKYYFPCLLGLLLEACLLTCLLIGLLLAGCRLCRLPRPETSAPVPDNFLSTKYPESFLEPSGV